MLGSYLPDARYRYEDVVADRFGFLRWTGKNPQVLVRYGVDSYVVENEAIVARTIHYVANERT